MDAIIESILGYVLILDPDITEDDFLTFVLNEVVDRALMYTNREQLIAQYELDLEDTTVDVADYVVPIPARLERPLAKVVMSNHKTTRANVDTAQKGVKSAEDNGQKISYTEGLETYFVNKTDTDIFSSIKLVLDRYRIPNIVENSNFSIRMR